MNKISPRQKAVRLIQANKPVINRKHSPKIDKFRNIHNV